MPLDPKYFGDNLRLKEHNIYLLNLLSPKDYCRLEDIVNNQLYCSIFQAERNYLPIDLVRYIQHKSNPYYFLGVSNLQRDFIWLGNKANLYYTYHYEMSDTSLSLLLLKYPEIKIPNTITMDEYYNQRNRRDATHRS